MTAVFAGPALAPANAQSGDFQACLQTIKADAVRQGVPAEIADRAFQGLTPDQKVVDLDSRQPEFSLTYAKYIGSSVSPERIAQELRRMLVHETRARAMNLALETGLVSAIMPEVAAMKGLFQGKPIQPEGDLWEHTLLVLELLPPAPSFSLAFAAIYLIWGSTYLAIRVAVADLPPFLMAGSRFLVAGAALFAWARWRGTAGPTRHEWRGALLIGIGVGVAAALRLALTEDRAGLLVVRSKGIDFATMSLVAASMVYIAWTIDPLGTR